MNFLKFRIPIIFLITFLFSCSNNSNKRNENIKQETGKKETLDISVSKPVAKKKTKEENKHPKVLTYTEIKDKVDELNKYYYEESKYVSDTISLKKKFHKDLFSYLTIQFKYMLSAELRILRNEFLARKGYIFKSKDLKEYFENHQWYQPKTDDMHQIRFNPLEEEIIDSIKIYEKSNKEIDADSMKKRLREYFKNNLNSEYGRNIIKVPSILFRRNIGYLIPNLSRHNKYWFNGKYIEIVVIDTLKKENLLFGLFGQIICPDQYCLYGGELITCDSLLNYLDSESIEFEIYESSEDENGVKYRFEAPNSSSSTLTIIRIKENGDIEVK